MGALMRAHDWTSTPLGPPETWPQGLRTTVRLALNTRHPMFIFWGPELICLYNDAYRQAIGSDRRHPGMLGRPGREVWDDVWDIIGPQIDLVTSGRGATWYEDHLVPMTRHGRRQDVWWTYSQSPIDDESAPNGIGGVLVLCNDVTDAHLAREAMRESEARFRAVFDSRLLGLTVFDATSGETLDINDRALEITGGTRAEFDAGLWDWRKITPPEYLSRDEQAVRQVLEQGYAAPFDKEYAQKDGSRVPVRLFMAPLPGQTGRMVVGIEDLTARRAAERSLRESEARFRTLMDAVPVKVWVTEADGSCSFLSRRWYERTGQTEAEALGFGWLAAVHPEDRAAAEHSFRTALGTKSSFRSEYRLRDARGRYYWAIDTAEPRFGEDGTFLGHVGAVIDISDRREAEQRQTLLAREVDHRAKNALAVVQAALRLTPKTDIASYTQAVEGRVRALARAHSMLADARWGSTDLRALLEAELDPFVAGQRAELSGPSVALPSHVSQGLAMIAHELATNAVKHGALSTPTGRIAVAWDQVETLDGAQRLLLRWTETGGPLVGQPPERRGFGSRVLEVTIRTQLGGAVRPHWTPGGLVCEFEVPLTKRPDGGHGPLGSGLTAAAPL